MLARTDTSFGEALISPADKVQHILSGSIFAIEHRQRVTTLMAEDHAFEQKVIGSASGVLAAVDQHAYFLEGFPINQRLVRSFHHDPVFTVLLQALLGLVADLHRSSLDHVSDVSLILKHI